MIRQLQDIRSVRIEEPACVLIIEAGLQVIEGKTVKFKVSSVGKGILSSGGVIIRAVIKFRSSVSRGVVCIRDKLLPGRTVYLGSYCLTDFSQTGTGRIFVIPGGASPPGNFYPIGFKVGITTIALNLWYYLSFNNNIDNWEVRFI